jgi:hypothetical protein
VKRIPTVLGVTRCKICNEILTMKNVYITSEFGVLKSCKPCYNANRIDTRTIESRRKYNLEAKYGITPEEFKRLKELHLGGCAVCKQPCSTGQELVVDHNHTTGKVRGLLCRRCNLALGYIGEDEDLIWNILEYLKQHGEFDERSFETIEVKE